MNYCIFQSFTLFLCRADDVSKWTRMEFQLDAGATDRNARLQLMTSRKGVIWLDQVSVMPVDTYKVCCHGRRLALIMALQKLRQHKIVEIQCFWAQESKGQEQGDVERGNVGENLCANI